MAIIKVEEVGQEFTGTVTECREVQGKFGPQVQFDFATGERLFIGVQAAARQLMRAGFASTTDDGKDVPNYEAVEGNTLTFGRDHNPNGKPYWSITMADGVDEAAAKPKAPKMTQEHVAKALDLHPHPAQKGAPTKAAGSWDDLVARYGMAYRAAESIFGDKRGAPTPDALQAMAFSLYKAARDEGISIPTKPERLTSAKAAKPQPDADPADDLPF